MENTTADNVLMNKRPKTEKKKIKEKTTRTVVLSF